SITDRLYVPEPDRRLRQEIVLGIGGVRALRALGIDSGVFHLNEGHSFLCAIERIRELRASRQMTLEEARLVARAGIVFTTHTPTWGAPEIADLLTRFVGPDWWDLDPADGRWHAVYEIPTAELWAIHGELKGKLLELTLERAEHPHELDLNALTIGFGRRFAPYKRANLLLRDRPRLTRLLP